MRPLYIIGIFFILLISGCNTEREWKVLDQYPNGDVKILREYTVKQLDTIYVYEKVFYNDSVLRVEGPLKEEKRNGLWKSYYPNGTKWSETSFGLGEMNGPTKTYYKNGQLRYEGFYSQGKVSGNWNWYDSTGVLNKHVDFDLENKK
jgi:antitoxin component YwqK of YwqJK toxin-antitoxin module